MQVQRIMHSITFRQMVSVSHKILSKGMERKVGVGFFFKCLLILKITALCL